MSRRILHVQWRSGKREEHDVTDARVIEIGTPQPGWQPSTINLGPPGEPVQVIVLVHGLEIPALWLDLSGGES